MMDLPYIFPSGAKIGAGEMNRTPDLLITNELLYRLSYTGAPLDSQRVDGFKRRDFTPQLCSHCVEIV